MFKRGSGPCQCKASTCSHHRDRNHSWDRWRVRDSFCSVSHVQWPQGPQCSLGKTREIQHSHGCPQALAVPRPWLSPDHGCPQTMAVPVPWLSLCHGCPQALPSSGYNKSRAHLGSSVTAPYPRSCHQHRLPQPLPVRDSVTRASPCPPALTTLWPRPHRCARGPNSGQPFPLGPRLAPLCLSSPW